jgi:hypothetical protein
VRTVNDVTIKNIKFQRGANSLVKISALGHGLRVDNVEANEAGDWGTESGFHAFAIIGDRDNKATGVHFSNILTHSQWNENGNAIETRNIDGGVFEDWTAYDLGNNVFEFWEEMENSIFRRTKAWNCKSLVWMANETQADSNPEGDTVHRNNLIENNYFRGYRNYKSPTGRKPAVLVASGVENIIQNNTFVGVRDKIIHENLKYDGEIAGNIYRNNIIYMTEASVGEPKPIIDFYHPAGDAVLESNVIYTVDDEPTKVTMVTGPENKKLSLAEWQALGYYTGNVMAPPLLVDVKDSSANPGDTAGPNLQIGFGSAIGMADRNMPADDVTGATRIGNAAGAYDQP